HRVLARHRAGRDAPAVRHQLRWQAGPRQLPGIRQCPDCRPAVRGRRTAAGGRGPAKGPHHQNRWEILMSNTDQKGINGLDVRPAPEAETASSFRLRPERPPITRLSRKALIGGTAFALILISAAVILALQTREKRAPASDELYSTDHHNVADKLASLPKDYGSIPPDVPRLGPPLPGDLGRPIVAAQSPGPLAI